MMTRPTDPPRTLLDKSSFARELTCPCCKTKSRHHVFFHAGYFQCHNCEWKFVIGEDGMTLDAGRGSNSD